jgi:membrane protease YdiL (CAAX protease family)
MIIGGFGPFCSAIVIIGISKGKDSLKNWLRTLFNFRIHVFWYLLGGILAPFVIASIHHLLYISFGGQSGIDFGLEWLIYFAYLIPTTLLTGGNEEPGWRGYITPVLIKRFNILIAQIIVGVFWAVWHFPMYFTGNWGSGSQPMVWLIIYCIPLSMILTWFFYNSKKSIIPAMLLHAGTNVVFRYFPMETKIFNSVEDEFTLIKAIVYWILAIILFVTSKGKLGYNLQDDK